MFYVDKVVECSAWEKHVVRAPTVFLHFNVEISQVDA